MRLYDIMKEEPEKQNVVEESQLPEIPGNEETAPAETAVVETPAAEEPKYKYTSWWKMPSYAKAEKEYQEQGKKQMEIAEKRAKRQRDLAIFGDLAKLGAQAYAKGGGVYKIDKITPQTEIANEKLRRVRDNNAAQIMAYAERMRTAQQRDAANELARNKAEYDYSIADAAAKAKAAKDERDYQYKVAKDAVDADLKERQLALEEDRLAETKKPDKYLAYDRYGNDKWFDSKESAETFSRNEGTWHEEEYDEVSTENYTNLWGEPQTKTTNRKKKTGYSKKPGEKKKNPMGSGKKANPMS
jgi:hypothetical protein